MTADFDIGAFRTEQQQALSAGDTARYQVNLRSARELLEPRIQEIEKAHPEVADRLRAEIEMTPPIR